MEYNYWVWFYENRNKKAVFVTVPFNSCDLIQGMLTILATATAMNGTNRPIMGGARGARVLFRPDNIRISNRKLHKWEH